MSNSAEHERHVAACADLKTTLTSAKRVVHTAVTPLLGGEIHSRTGVLGHSLQKTARCITRALGLLRSRRWWASEVEHVVGLWSFASGSLRSLPAALLGPTRTQSKDAIRAITGPNPGARALRRAVGCRANCCACTCSSAAVC